MFDDLKHILTRFYAKRINAQDHQGGALCAGALHTTTTLSIVNQKGGCAKTTTAINLCGCLAQKGYRVLLIDLDPQAHASLGMGMAIDGAEQSIHQVLVEGVGLERVVRKTSITGFDIAPANSLLSGAQLDLAGMLGRECILKFVLRRFLLGHSYDYIVLDCSPTLNLVTINALVAADYALIPIQPQYYSLEGMKELFHTIDIVKDRLNTPLEILGILVTLFDTRIKINHQMVQEIRDYFKEMVFTTVIHLNVKLSEAPIHKKPIHLYAPDSKGSQDYWGLTDEVLTRTVARRGSSARVFQTNRIDSIDYARKEA